MTFAICTCNKAQRIIANKRVLFNNASRIDPARMMTLQRAFISDGHRRFNALARDIRQSIIDDDCFDIEGAVNSERRRIEGLARAGRKAFAFTTSQAKIDGFMDWLRKQEEVGVLEVIYRPGTYRGLGHWTDTYIETAYAKGIKRGRTELKKAGYTTPATQLTDEGIRGILTNPIHADRVGIMYARTFEDLKSVTQVMNTQIQRLIADGLTSGLSLGIAEGKHPMTIARELSKDVLNRVDKIGKTRLRTIARTETARAHHVATIAEYRQASEEMNVVVKAEWLTAGFNVCPICIDIEEGGPYKLDVIEGMLPAHPNCRCVATPSPVE